eukprot:TRINITY_DN11199_c0_g1_i1.p1 TRINITY_DN11199_c0_g1~~TRINITY_DN11199_c0_g1_i1.p1  ORF type:complete len:588 (-),score=156.40 TRINITY_DN11199_c0_g1_i1:19-1782(-)
MAPSRFLERQVQISVLDQLAKELKLGKHEDWYQFDRDTLVSKYPSLKGMFTASDGSISRLMMSAYPEKNWKIYRFRAVPSGYWNDASKHRNFFNDVAAELGIKNYEDWYKVRAFTIKDLGGAGLLRHYSNCLAKALQTIFPDHDWKLWNFDIVPRGFWNDKANQLAFFEDIAKKLNVKKWEDWYRVEISDVKQLGGEYLLHRYYHNVLLHALRAVYPEAPFLFWKFDEYPSSEWESLANQKLFLDFLFQKLSLKQTQDWYGVSSEVVTKFGGGGLLRMYDDNLLRALAAVYPGEDWQGLQYPPSFWEDANNQRQFLDKLGRQLKIKRWEDWYDKSRQDFVDNGGWPLLHKYGDSHIRALAAVYPEHKWQAWKFASVPKGYWDDDANVMQAVAALSEEIGIEQISDWKMLTPTQLDSLGMGTLRKKYGGVLALLQKLFPSHSWERVHSKKVQYVMFRNVRMLFPEAADVHLDYQHLGMLYTATNKPMELDVYVPSLKIAFEYQGAQHFDQSASYFGAAEQLLKRDEEKRVACKKQNITLIEVPYWWDQTFQSLAATVRELRPDLVTENKLRGAKPIPKEKPKERQDPP